MRKLVDLLKADFFAGVLVLIPIGVIVWIAGWILGLLWTIRALLPDGWNPEHLISDPTLATLVDIALTLSAVLALAIGVSGLGWASKQYLGRKVLDGIGHIIERIPVLRSIYSALDQLLKTLAAQGAHQFNRVVYIEYPRKDCWTLAFVTGTAQPTWTPQGRESATEYLNVYVPTTPNPTSGFYLVVPESETRDAHMKVEEAFKVLLSLGIAQGKSLESGAGRG